MSRPRTDPIEKIQTFFMVAPLAEAYDILSRLQMIMDLRKQYEMANVQEAKEQAVRRGRPLGSKNKAVTDSTGRIVPHASGCGCNDCYSRSFHGKPDSVEPHPADCDCLACMPIPKGRHVSELETKQ